MLQTPLKTFKIGETCFTIARKSPRYFCAPSENASTKNTYSTVGKTTQRANHREVAASRSQLRLNVCCKNILPERNLGLKYFVSQNFTSRRKKFFIKTLTSSNLNDFLSAKRRYAFCIHACIKHKAFRGPKCGSTISIRL